MASPPREPGAPARKESVAVLRGGAQVSEHRLKNGLRVLFAERRGDPVVAVLLYYAVGSRHETEREAGVSHFLEHMMFKGTPTFGKGEVDRMTTALGGQNNAFTSNDHTAYWFELASDRWEVALAIESDRMRHLSIDPEEFDAERAVVLEELSMGEDDPWRVLYRHVQARLYPRHPYGKPIIGYRDTLERMTAEDMRNYYQRFYHPGNATLVICGDVGPKAALAAVRKHFGSIPARVEAAETPEPPAPGGCEGPLGEVRLRLFWDDPARRLCMAWPTAKIGSDEDYDLDVVSTLLTDGRLARLQRSLVLDRRLATHISVSNDTRVEGGVFWLFAECASEVEPAVLEAAIEEELDRLRTENVAAAELKRCKARLRSVEAYGAETVSDLAEELGSFAVDADWRMALDGGERHAQVTAKRVRETAARVLTRDRRVLGWCLPQEDRDRAPTPEPKKAKPKARAARSRGKAAARSGGSKRK